MGRAEDRSPDDYVFEFDDSNSLIVDTVAAHIGASLAIGPAYAGHTDR